MTPTLPSEVLDAAAELITPEGAWIQGSLAADSCGAGARFTSASCWCAEGAIAKVVGQYLGGEAYYAPDRYLSRVVFDGDGNRPPATWNDDPNRTQAEVISALRRAAELARSENS